MSRGGRWWLKLWLLSIPFTVFMMYVQPVLIDPLYNKFTTLSDPRLEARILETDGLRLAVRTDRGVAGERGAANGLAVGLDRNSYGRRKKRRDGV